MASMTRRRSSPATPAGASAAERLEAVRAEIAELSKPLPPDAPADADVGALTDTIIERTHRHQALLLMTPALERAALVERRPALEAEIADAEKAWLSAGEFAREVQEREQEIIAQRVDAVAAAHAAERNHNHWVVQLDQLDAELRRHDEIYPSPAA